MDGVAAAGGARDAHVRLMRVLDDARFDDAMARSPSALPGWTIGHLLTHLARNADSHTRMVEAAKRGETVAQYPGGHAQRESEIEAGAGRSAVALLDDVRRADDELADAYASLDEAAWQGRATRWDQRWPVIDLPFLRWREVALHTIDFGLPQIGFDVWHPQYVEHELRRQIAALAARPPTSTALRLAPRDASWSTVVMRGGDGSADDFITIDCTANELLAWTVGRFSGEPHWPPLAPWVGVP